MAIKIRLLSLLIFLFFCQKGFACMCMEATIETADFNYYDEIFLGKVLNVKRIEVIEGSQEERFTIIGTETTFEVIKKWKGSNKKIVKIFTQVNSCGIDFTIRYSRWIVSGHEKPFLGDEFKKEYPGMYLQTDGCQLNIEEQDYEEFERNIQKMDEIFRDEIILEKNQIKRWLIVILFFVLALIIGVYIGLKK